MSGFSTREQLEKLQEMLRAYWLLPEVIRGKHIPGGFLERSVAWIRDGETSGKYDFVDIVGNTDGIGWQVKSTKTATPVTWKRAKIANKAALITASKSNNDSERERGLRELGNAIIDFCNDNIQKSYDKYDSLMQMNYSRLIHRRDNSVAYFERVLCTRENPILFIPDEFSWEWRRAEEVEQSAEEDSGEGSSSEVGRRKEVALYGTHMPTQTKWWAWHGSSENQLHFKGEKVWWPTTEDDYAFTMSLPSESEVMSFDDLVELSLVMKERS